MIRDDIPVVADDDSGAQALLGNVLVAVAPEIPEYGPGGSIGHHLNEDDRRRDPGSYVLEHLVQGQGVEVSIRSVVPRVFVAGHRHDAGPVRRAQLHTLHGLWAVKSAFPGPENSFGGRSPRPAKIARLY